MKVPIREVARCVTGLVTPERSVLVGIDGGAGSGKTTFARELAASIKEATVPVSMVHTDSFCRPSSERVNHRFPLATVSDLDWKRLRDQVIAPLRAGGPARFRLYDWTTDSLADRVTIDVGAVTIIEGVTATRNELSE